LLSRDQNGLRAKRAPLVAEQRATEQERGAASEALAGIEQNLADACRRSHHP